MLVSHRRHAPPLDGVRLELDRAIAERWVLRRVRLDGLIHDERLLAATAPDGRSRLLLILDGRLTAFHDGCTYELGPGQVLAVARAVDLRTCGGNATTLEIDWDASEAADVLHLASAATGLLHPSTRAAVVELADAVHRAMPDDVHELERAAGHAVRALRSEGFPLQTERFERMQIDSDQALWTAIDGVLSRLENSPDVNDLSRVLAWSRRTLLRKLTRLHERYHVHVHGDWRSQRDFYRLLIGSLFLSHGAATTGRVARWLGYRSPEALCHAFARAGLPAPGDVRRALGQSSSARIRRPP